MGFNQPDLTQGPIYIINIYKKFTNKLIWKKL